mmetsp:Transcript_3927/g.10047  ORF Transcript_3927/g.10047 Transcript_3927/m.10047 type:complete len:250 (+) Transcript_3927:39-788(+)
MVNDAKTSQPGRQKQADTRATHSHELVNDDGDYNGGNAEKRRHAGKAEAGVGNERRVEAPKLRIDNGGAAEPQQVFREIPRGQRLRLQTRLQRNGLGISFLQLSSSSVSGALPLGRLLHWQHVYRHCARRGEDLLRRPQIESAMDRHRQQRALCLLLEVKNALLERKHEVAVGGARPLRGHRHASPPQAHDARDGFVHCLHRFLAVAAVNWHHAGQQSKPSEDGHLEQHLLSDVFRRQTAAHDGHDEWV